MQSITTHFYSKNTTRDSQHIAPHLSTSESPTVGEGFLCRAQQPLPLLPLYTQPLPQTPQSHHYELVHLAPPPARAARPTEVGTYHCAL